MVFNRNVMFHQGLAVDDAIAPHARACIDYRAVHDDGACTERGVCGDVGARRNDHRQRVTDFFQAIKKTNSRFGRLDLTNRDKGMGEVGGHGLQIGISAEHGIAKHAGTHLVRQTDQPAHCKASFVLDHVYACPGVTAGAGQQDRRPNQFVRSIPS